MVLLVRSSKEGNGAIHSKGMVQCSMWGLYRSKLVFNSEGFFPCLNTCYVLRVWSSFLVHVYRWSLHLYCLFCVPFHSLSWPALNKHRPKKFQPTQKGIKMTAASELLISINCHTFDYTPWTTRDWVILAIILYLFSAANSWLMVNSFGFAERSRPSRRHTALLHPC